MDVLKPKKSGSRAAVRVDSTFWNDTAGRWWATRATPATDQSSRPLLAELGQYRHRPGLCQPWRQIYVAHLVALLAAAQSNRWVYGGRTRRIRAGRDAVDAARFVVGLALLLRHLGRGGSRTFVCPLIQFVRSQLQTCVRWVVAVGSSALSRRHLDAFFFLCFFFMCASACVHAWVYVCVRACVRACVCVCVCVCVSVRSSDDGLSWEPAAGRRRTIGRVGPGHAELHARPARRRRRDPLQNVGALKAPPTFRHWSAGSSERFHFFLFVSCAYLRMERNLYPLPLVAKWSVLRINTSKIFIPTICLVSSRKKICESSLLSVSPVD